MKRFFGLCLAMFVALVAIALVGGDSGAVAGIGCHGKARSCHGGLFAHKNRCHGGRLHRQRRCHGEAASACDSCGDASASGCSSCGGEGGCGGESSGCAGGGCEGGSVISDGVPTPVEAPAAPAKT